MTDRELERVSQTLWAEFHKHEFELFIPPEFHSDEKVLGCSFCRIHLRKARQFLDHVYGQVWAAIRHEFGR